jgi:uncharacterized membrane protein
MAYCDKCGTQVAGHAPFCSQCGAAQKPAAPPPTAAPAAPASGLAENVAATLSYAFFWLGGLIFLLIDKRPFVRFHAAQSMIIFLGLHIVKGMLGVVWGIHFLHGGWDAFGPGIGLFHLLELLTLVLWVVLMVRAHRGEWFKVPIVWEIAESFGTRVPSDRR